MDLIAQLAPTFEHYLTLHRVHDTKTYDRPKRKRFGEPVIEHTMHRPRCVKGESWTYIAIPLGVHLQRLDREDMLYVGAQTQDRMFRPSNANFDHGEMRAGHADDSLVPFLRGGREVAIHRAPAHALMTAVTTSTNLAIFRPLLGRPDDGGRRHPGWWFEQLLLYTYPGRWRWNSRDVEEPARSLLKSLLPRPT